MRPKAVADDEFNRALGDREKRRKAFNVDLKCAPRPQGRHCMSAFRLHSCGRPLFTDRGAKSLRLLVGFDVRNRACGPAWRPPYLLFGTVSDDQVF